MTNYITRFDYVTYTDKAIPFVGFAKEPDSTRLSSSWLPDERVFSLLR
jgi:hypothetical protein